jgi:hypothetical protein
MSTQTSNANIWTTIVQRLVKPNIMSTEVGNENVWTTIAQPLTPNEWTGR